MRRLVVGLAVALLAAPAPAADKQWQTLDQCRQMDRPANDGDSFGLLCGRTRFVLRLYFVDAPETNLQFNERAREQAQHFGATLDDTLQAGYRARDLVRNALGARFLVLTKKASAPGRSKEPRYYGLVQVGDRFLHETLLSEGLARVKGVSTTMPDGTKSRDTLNKLRALEGEARAQRKGAWARSTR